MSVTIYALCDSRESDSVRRVRYIGQTMRPLDRRLVIHWQTALAGAKEHRAAWMRCVRANGGRVIIQALFAVSEGDADACEIATIAAFVAIGSDLTNRTAGGGGVRGHRHSAVTRQLMSAAAQRRVYTQERKQKMSASLSRVYSTPARREFMRSLNLGRRRSAETKRRMGTAKVGEKNPNAKLTIQIADEMRAMRGSGATLAAIAAHFAVSKASVHRVVHGASWVSA